MNDRTATAASKVTEKAASKVARAAVYALVMDDIREIDKSWLGWVTRHNGRRSWPKNLGGCEK